MVKEDVAELFCILDGADSIGGTKLVIHTDDGDIMIDFGLNYKKKSQYFDEFLSQRSQVGLKDYFTTGLLPRVHNIYREDLLKLSPKCSWEYSLKLSKVVISHAHLDHAGMLPFLRPDVPVLCSVESHAILLSLQETSGGKVENEFIRISKRELQTSKAHRRTVKGAQTSRKFSYEDDRILTFSTDHSIPGARMCAVKVQGVWIVYTGDFRFGGLRDAETRQAMRKISSLEGEKVIFVEGTRFNSKKKSKRATERDVLDVLQRYISQYQGKLVVVDCGLRNIDRLSSVFEVSGKLNRTPVLMPKTFHLIETLLDFTDETRYRSILNQARVYIRKRNIRKWEKELLERSRTVDENDINKSPGSYVLCFNYYDILELSDMNTTNGGYIYSNTEPFNEEMEIDLNRLRNWVSRLGMTFHGWEEESPLHVSGHLSPNEVLEFLDSVQPVCVIPVHCEEPLEYSKFLQKNGFSVLNPLFPQ